MQANGIVEPSTVLFKGNFNQYNDVDLFIIDEADAAVREFAVLFSDSKVPELQGFFNLLDRNVMMCSATFNAFEKGFLERVMEIPENGWLRIKPVREFFTDEHETPLYNCITAETPIKLLKALDNVVISSQGIPMIFFVEDIECQVTIKAIKNATKAIGEATVI